jgi:hypothetical protein
MHGSTDSYDAPQALARLVLHKSYSMNRNLRTLKTDLRAWLIRLGVTVIECVFVGCGIARQPAVVPCRTRHFPPIDDPRR